MSRVLLIVVAVFLFAASTLQAKKPEEKAVKADTPEKFAVLVEAIRHEMAPGKRYEFLNNYNRDMVNKSLDRMADMLERAGSVEAMSQEDKTKLFSIQEEVNGVLAKNADTRLVCTHIAPTGSNIPMTQCKTVRELANRREAARRKIFDMENSQRALDAPMGEGTGARAMGLDGGRNGG